MCKNIFQNLNINWKPNRIQKRQTKQGNQKQMSTPALTVTTPSETPAVQDCWLQTPHPGSVLSSCACSGPPHHQGQLNLLSHRTEVSETLVFHILMKTGQQEWRGALPMLPGHTVLWAVPSDLGLTTDEPKSLKLAQPGGEKSVKTPRYKSVGDISSRIAWIFNLLYSNPQMEHFSRKNKEESARLSSHQK